MNVSLVDWEVDSRLAWLTTVKGRLAAVVWLSDASTSATSCSAALMSPDDLDWITSSVNEVA